MWIFLSKEEYQRMNWSVCRVIRWPISAIFVRHSSVTRRWLSVTHHTSPVAGHPSHIARPSLVAHHRPRSRCGLLAACDSAQDRLSEEYQLNIPSIHAIGYQYYQLFASVCIYYASSEYPQVSFLIAQPWWVIQMILANIISLAMLV